jgi:hypothetical protein
MTGVIECTFHLFPSRRNPRPTIHELILSAEILEKERIRRAGGHAVVNKEIQVPHEANLVPLGGLPLLRLNDHPWAVLFLWG